MHMRASDIFIEHIPIICIVVNPHEPMMIMMIWKVLTLRKNNHRISIVLQKVWTEGNFFEFMSEEGDESVSFEIQLIRLDIFSVGGFKRNFVMK